MNVFFGCIYELWPICKSRKKNAFGKWALNGFTHKQDWNRCKNKSIKTPLQWISCSFGWKTNKTQRKTCKIFTFQERKNSQSIQRSSIFHRCHFNNIDHTNEVSQVGFYTNLPLNLRLYYLNNFMKIRKPVQTIKRPKNVHFSRSLPTKSIENETTTTFLQARSSSSMEINTVCNIQFAWQ